MKAFFDKASSLYHETSADAATTPWTDAQVTTLRELLITTFNVWKSIRHRSTVKSRLQTRLHNVHQSLKRRNTITMAITFLSRTYLSVKTFIEAAETLSIFQSIECIPVKVTHPPTEPKSTARKPDSGASETRGCTVSGNGWAHYFQSQTTIDTFRIDSGRKSATCMPSFSYCITIMLSIHPMTRQPMCTPYIGCSKRCCLLCYCFISAHGRFRVRGTHETIIHKWTLPALTPEMGPNADFQSATQNMYQILMVILQNLFEKPYSLRAIEALAQSSAALSTARTVCDQEVGQMEKSELSMRYVLQDRYF